MSRNYGIGSRVMADAACMVLTRRYHGSKQTIYDHGQRFRNFSGWVREHHNVKKMEDVTFALVVLYGQWLQSQHEAGFYVSTSTAQNRVCAVNAVMRLATKGKWVSVCPRKDCGIGPRHYVATVDKSMSQYKHDEAVAVVGERLAAMMGLQRTLGLRFKESALINAKLALRQALKTGRIKLVYGTKGGRPRSVPCRPCGLLALERAAAVQDWQSMVPKELQYIEFRTKCYDLAKQAGIRFHSERHFYANERYTEITGAPSPVHAGWGRRERIRRLAEYLGVSMEEARAIDVSARLQISKELGHNRKEVTGAYIG